MRRFRSVNARTATAGVVNVCLGFAGVLALTAASTAAVREVPPTPESSRPCGSRGDGSKPQELPSPVGALIGPLVIWPSIRNRVEAYGTRSEWAFYVKAPIVLPARSKVTLAVSPEARHLIGFQAASGAWVSSVRFEACRENVRAYPGAYNGTVGKYTGFPFGFGLARRSVCVPLEVWVDGRATPIRRVVPFGRRSCP
jgi:hypothetical protein